jgi:isocitrate dehydrogenase kinase/phosphatase
MISSGSDPSPIWSATSTTSIAQFGHLKGMPAREVNFQIQVLGSAFYRNKAAYIIGKAINGSAEYAFAIPVLHDENGQLYLDTILLDAWRIGLLFSLSRAYFMVDMEVPSGFVQFLRSILPNKPRSELYIMLGLGKQGKTMFFRDFIYHLHHSEDKFIMAPGIRGLVMLVFTLPSYPYVFKIIKDVFGASKNMDRATVKRKFMMVKQVDRVGRMADTLEFSNAAFPLKRFDPEVMEELQTLAPSCFEIDGETLIIKHIYIERRMEPLNIHLDRMERTNNIEGARARHQGIRQRHSRTGSGQHFPRRHVVEELWRHPLRPRGVL